MIAHSASGLVLFYRAWVIQIRGSIATDAVYGYLLEQLRRPYSTLPRDAR